MDGAPPVIVVPDDGGHPDAQSTADAAAPDALAPVTVVSSGNRVQIGNGLLSIEFDTQTGLSSYAFRGTTYVSGAYASTDVAGTYLTSNSYPSHRFDPAGVTAIADGFGAGKRVPIDSTAPNKPTIRQIYSVYEGKPYFFVEENVVSATSIASNYLGAVIVDENSGWVAAPSGADRRILDVPFDNDEWVRYDSRVFGPADFSGTGYEVAAIYESTSRSGLVVGSVTHDFWKTGIYYDYAAAQGRLRRLNVWGGAATPDVSNNAGPTYGKDGPHDVAKHGNMMGTTLASPRIFVGYFDDYRDGLETFGRANAQIAPPKAWAPPSGTGRVIFGWMSWGAYGLGIDANTISAASDFVHMNLTPSGFGDGSVFINIDAGLRTDPTPVVAHIHGNGQKAGTYRVPFTYFYDHTDPAPLSHALFTGSTYTYADVVLKDDTGTPIQRHSAYILDATHPGTRDLITRQMQSVAAQGFDYVKLDFLTDGALEGQHADPNVRSGIQAYNQAMAFIGSLLPPDVFVSLSIAPLFPSQYGHARRISCDVIGQLNDLMSPAYAHYGSTEYMLNSVTYGWWMSGTIYPFNDPDAMALYRFFNATNAIPEAWAKTRVTASAIAGTVFLDTTDYASPDGAARAMSLLTHPAIDDLVKTGRTFRPIEGNTGRVDAPISGSTATNSGSAATDTFMLDPQNGTYYLAAFNFDQTNAATKTIDLARAGVPPGTYTATDLWTGTALGRVTGSVDIALQAGESRLIALAP